ncbi:hypothetical protein BH23BAC4_BH23BAC4_11910 [soil metagenome]
MILSALTSDGLLALAAFSFLIGLWRVRKYVG